LAAAALLAVPLVRVAGWTEKFDGTEGCVVENPFMLGLGKAPFEGAEIVEGCEPNEFNAPPDV
jgi:hypothetical protein